MKMKMYRYYPEVKVLVKFPNERIKFRGFRDGSFGDFGIAKDFLKDVRYNYKKAGVPAKFRIIKRCVG